MCLGQDHEHLDSTSAPYTFENGTPFVEPKSELNDAVEAVAAIAVLGELLLLALAAEALAEYVKRYGVDGDESLDEFDEEFEQWLDQVDASQEAAAA